MPKGRRAQAARIILVSNSLSTWNRKCLPDIHAVLKKYPEVVHFEGENVKKLYKQLKAFRDTSPELLILNGGDGTIHTALTYIINKKIFKEMPPLAILGGGMTNMIARDLNTGEKASVALEKILACHSDIGCHEKTKERRLIRVNVEGKKKTEYGLFFGSGSLVNVIRYCTRRLYTLGIKGKSAQVVAVFLYYLSRAFRWGRPGTLGYSPLMTIRLDNGKIVRGKFSSLAATTLHRLIFGSKAPVGHAGFPFYTLGPSFWAMVISLVRGARGTIDKTKSKWITLDYTKKAVIEESYPFTLDGEIFKVKKGRSITLTHTKPYKFVSFN